MKTKYLAAALAVAVAGMVAVPVAMGGASTTVTIKNQGGDFSGVVKSENLKLCAAERKVVVLKKKPGKDQKIGTDTTGFENGKWRWSTGNSGQNSGTFYAKAPKTSNCNAAKSKEVTL